MKPSLVTALAITGVVAILANPARPAAEPAAEEQPAPAEIWRATCGYCHGGLMNAPELRGLKLPEQFVMQVVRNGAAGMPPFHDSEISDADLRALIAWIAEQPRPAAAPNT